MRVRAAYGAAFQSGAGSVSVLNESVKAGRVDSASRVILATPRTLFRTFLDPETLVAWRAPEGMSARLHHFEPRIGGGYGMVLRYAETAPATAGKTRAYEDEVEVKFLKFLPEERVVEEVHFISTDPAFL